MIIVAVLSVLLVAVGISAGMGYLTMIIINGVSSAAGSEFQLNFWLAWGAYFLLSSIIGAAKIVLKS